MKRCIGREIHVGNKNILQNESYIHLPKNKPNNYDFSLGIRTYIHPSIHNITIKSLTLMEDDYYDKDRVITRKHRSLHIISNLYNREIN